MCSKTLNEIQDVLLYVCFIRIRHQQTDANKVNIRRNVSSLFRGPNCSRFDIQTQHLRICIGLFSKTFITLIDTPFL